MSIHNKKQVRRFSIVALAFAIMALVGLVSSNFASAASGGAAQSTEHSDDGTNGHPAKCDDGKGSGEDYRSSLTANSNCNDGGDDDECDDHGDKSGSDQQSWSNSGNDDSGDDVEVGCPPVPPAPVEGDHIALIFTQACRSDGKVDVIMSGTMRADDHNGVIMTSATFGLNGSNYSGAAISAVVASGGTVSGTWVDQINDSVGDFGSFSFVAKSCPQPAPVVKTSVNTPVCGATGYTVTINNSGNADATNVMVGTSSVGNLAAGASQTISVTGFGNVNVTGGNIASITVTAPANPGACGTSTPNPQPTNPDAIPVTL